jgi:hypothetical protein
MTYYSLDVSFIGNMLYIALDDGVYGENKNRNAAEVEYIKDRFKDYLSDGDRVSMGPFPELRRK